VDPVLAREPRDEETARFQGEEHLVARRALAPRGWSLLLLTPLRLVTLNRLAENLVTLLVSILVLAFSKLRKTGLLSAARTAQSQRRYRGLVETLHDWVSIVDTKGICLFTNSAGQRALGPIRGRSRGKEDRGDLR
jgi:PAS domain-containing protein